MINIHRWYETIFLAVAQKLYFVENVLFHIYLRLGTQ